MNKHIILILVICTNFCACGRKQKNIFSFDNQETQKISKLDLPAVKGVKAKRHPLGAVITWFDLNLSATANPQAPYLCCKNLAGYNVYRLARTNIIPRHPCNKRPLKITTFVDKKLPQGKRNIYYLVRAVFSYNQTEIEGPTSLVVKLNE